MNIKEQIYKNKDELINILKQLVSYNTIEKKKEGDTPFGIANKECLEKALTIASSYGLKTKNLDNYCGYAEIGEGEIIGIATHLDIVDAADGWDTDPFVLTQKDDYLYGRGTSDDKGAAAACLIALKIIKDLNLNLNNKRVRLIFGCNEETGSKCMEYYNKKEGPFLLGFTPDSEFPCINGEKGHIKGTFKCSNTTILNIKGGSSSNVVCDKCIITIKKNSYNKDDLVNYMNKNNLQVNFITENDQETITVIGKSAHASTPHLGINAITHTMYALKEAQFNDHFVTNYCHLIDIDSSGKLLNINCEDKYGNLTMVNGTISQEKGIIEGTFDIRVPVTVDINQIISTLNNINNEFIKFNILSSSKSIYYSEDSYLVKSLMTAYQNVTKDYNSRCETSGGGTYAKTLENCIAFGCEFKNNNNNIHSANERVKIEELLLQVELYIEAIVQLTK